MATSQYELDRQARVKARADAKAAGKTKVKAKAPVALTPAQQEQKDIDAYRAGAAKNVKDTRTLESLTRYGNGKSTATSGGSKAVRKIDPTFKGKTTAARTGNPLIDKLRRNRLKYIQ